MDGVGLGCGAAGSHRAVGTQEPGRYRGAVVAVLVPPTPALAMIKCFHTWLFEKVEKWLLGRPGRRGRK